MYNHTKNILQFFFFNIQASFSPSKNLELKKKMKSLYTTNTNGHIYTAHINKQKLIQ
jgi:hypothetical protein